MKWVLLVVLLLCVLGAGALFTMCSMATSDLKEEAHYMLQLCGDGKWQEAYERTSSPFQQAHTVESLRAYMEPRMRAGGRYKHLGSVKGFEIKRGSGEAYDDSLTVEVIFENGTWPGTFRFVTEGADKRIFGITLDIPASKLPQAQRADLEPRARELVQLFADGQLVALYDRFAAPLKQAWPAEKYQEQLSGLRSSLGPFQKATLVEVTEVDGVQEVEFAVQFQNAAKVVRIKLAEARGAWIPVGFFIGAPGASPPGGTAESDAPDSPPAEKEAGQDK